MITTTTITEALAELKTLDKRIGKKREAIGGFLLRQELLKDPLEKQGGSLAYISGERQSIDDLENRVVAIRTAIQNINAVTPIMIAGKSRSITEWLIWRRDVAPKQQQFLAQMRKVIEDVRKKAMQAGAAMVQPGETAKSTNDVIVNVDEKRLSEDAEALETTLGTLDGLLSLKNATVTITV